MALHYAPLKNLGCVLLRLSLFFVHLTNFFEYLFSKRHCFKLQENSHEQNRRESLLSCS